MSQAFFQQALLTEGESLQHECAVAGVFLSNGKRNAAASVAVMLRAQNHRGPQGWGIASLSQDEIIVNRVRDFGKVPPEIPAAQLRELSGRLAIGHCRYATAGGKGRENLQPFQTMVNSRPLLLAHNGNLTNASKLKRRLQKQGVVFHSTSDTEVMLHLIARELPCHKAGEAAIAAALDQVRGAYSLVILWGGCLFAACDPHGVRPLSIGRLGGMTLVASETCAFSDLGAALVRDVEPGEIVTISGSGEVRSLQRTAKELRRCAFEKLYFANGRSLVWGELAYRTRERLGRQLARENRGDREIADVVVAAPYSGIPAARGFAEELGLPYIDGIQIRPEYDLGRSFLQVSQRARDRAAKAKYVAVEGLICGKRVLVVDDSIVRGTTTRRIALMLKKAGASAVHFRSTAPRMISPCYYGVDIPDRSKLIASFMNDDEIARFVRATSVRFLSLPGMHRVIGSFGWCTSCFTGKYPRSLGTIRPVEDLVQIRT